MKDESQVNRELKEMLRHAPPPKYEIRKDLKVHRAGQTIDFSIDSVFFSLPVREATDTGVHFYHTEACYASTEDFKIFCVALERELKLTERDLVETAIVDALSRSVEAEQITRVERGEDPNAEPRYTLVNHYRDTLARHLPEFSTGDTLAELRLKIATLKETLQAGQITCVDLSPINNFRCRDSGIESLIFPRIHLYFTPVPAFRYERTPSGELRQYLRKLQAH